MPFKENDTLSGSPDLGEHASDPGGASHGPSGLASGAAGSEGDQSVIDDLLRAFEGKRPPRPKVTKETDGHHEAAYQAIAAPADRTAETPAPEPKVQVRDMATDPMAMGVRPPRAQDVPTDPSTRPPAVAPRDVSTFEISPPRAWRPAEAGGRGRTIVGIGVAIALALLGLAVLRKTADAPTDAQNGGASAGANAPVVVTTASAATHAGPAAEGTATIGPSPAASIAEPSSAATRTTVGAGAEQPAQGHRSVAAAGVSGVSGVSGATPPTHTRSPRLHAAPSPLASSSPAPPTAPAAPSPSPRTGPAYRPSQEIQHLEEHPY